MLGAIDLSIGVVLVFRALAITDMLTIIQVGAHVDVLSHARLELQLVSQCVILVEIELSEVGQVFVKDVRVVRRR